MSDWDENTIDDQDDDDLSHLKGGGQWDWGIDASGEDVGQDFKEEPIPEEEGDALVDDWMKQAEAGTLDLNIEANNKILDELQVLSTQGNLASEISGEGTGYEDQGHNTSSMFLQLDRFRHMSPSQLQYTYELLTEPALTGQRSKTRTNNDGTIYGVTAEEAEKAAVSFNKTVHGRGQEFAGELKKIIDRANVGSGPVGSEKGVRDMGGHIRASRSISDQVMMMGMLGITAEAKEVSGPGMRLLGENLNIERDKKDNEDLAWLTGKMTEVAHLYNRGATQEADPDLYGKRVAATEIGLNKWLMDYHPGQPVLDYNTGLQLEIENDQLEFEKVFQSTAIPLPEDLGVRGLVRTGNKAGTWGGSPHTRLSFASMFPSQDELTSGGTVAWNKEAWDASEASNYTEKQLKELDPTAKSSLFSYKALGKTGVDESYEKLQKDFKRMADITRRLTPTTADENFGNYKRSMALGRTEEELAKQEAMNAARVYGFEQSKYLEQGYDLSEQLNFEATGYHEGGTTKGTDKGGMYANEGMSETDEFVELVMEGTSIEDAASIIYKTRGMEALDAELIGPKEITDRDVYLARTQAGLESGTYFEQRSPGWHKQREGLLTGSTVKKLENLEGKKGQRDLARQLHEGWDEVQDNSYMKQGRKYEPFVQADFEKQTGLVAEEAYFETNPDLPGFGVSPDAFVFDKYGKSQGVAEFKMHDSVAAMGRGMKDYYNQLQLQMAVTKSKNVHFYRMNMDTNEILYDNVEYNEEHVAELVKGGANVQVLLEELMRKDLRDLPANAAEHSDEMVGDEMVNRFKAFKAKEEKTVAKHQAYQSPTASDTQKFETKMAKEGTRMRAEDAKMLEALSKEELGKLSQVSKEEDSMWALSEKAASKTSKEEASMWKTLEREKSSSDAAHGKSEDAYWKKKNSEEDKFNKKRATEEEKASKRKKKYDKEEYFARKENTERDLQAKLDATKEHSRQMKAYGNEFKKAVGGLVGMLKKGSTEGMDIIKRSAVVGMDEERALGMVEMSVVEGNLERTEAMDLVFGAAEIQTDALSGSAGLANFQSMQKEVQSVAGRAGYGKIFAPMQMDDLRSMKPGQMLPWMKERIDAIPDAQVRGRLWKASKLPMGIMLDDVSGEELSGAKMTFEVDRFRKGDRGLRDADVIDRAVRQATVTNAGEELAAGMSGMQKLMDHPMDYIAAGAVSGYRVLTDASDKNKGTGMFGKMSKKSEIVAAAGGVESLTPEQKIEIDRLVDTPALPALPMPTLAPSQSIGQVQKYDPATQSEASKAIQVQVESLVKVEVKEDEISAELTNTHGNNSVAVQPRNGPS